MAENVASRIEDSTCSWLWHCWREEVYSFKTYQGIFAPRSCHTASIVRRVLDGTQKKAEQPTRMQRSNAAAAWSCCIHLLRPTRMQDGRGVQKCAEVVRDMKPLACCRARIQTRTQRSSFVFAAAPNNFSFEALVSSIGLCRPVNMRRCSRSPPRNCSSFATTSPARAGFYRHYTIENISRHLRDLIFEALPMLAPWSRWRL